MSAWSLKSRPRAKSVPHPTFFPRVPPEQHARAPWLLPGDDGTWVRTTDLATIDEDGFLYVTGRVTDMVISGGVNIYPAESERVLGQHPDVIDVAVFGVPDAEMGERVVGLVCTTSPDVE